MIGIAVAIAAIATAGVADASSSGAKTTARKPRPEPMAAPATGIAATGDTTLTLVTGQRIRLTPGPQGVAVNVLSVPSGTSPLIDTFKVGTDTYVVPRDAAPYLNTLLDPGLFDVSRLSGLGSAVSQGSPRVSITWRGNRHAAALPGINVHGKGKVTAGTVSTSGAQSLGAALTAKFAADHHLRAPGGTKASAAVDSLAQVSRISLATPMQAPYPGLAPAADGSNAATGLDQSQSLATSGADTSGMPATGAQDPTNSSVRLRTLTLQAIDRDGSVGSARFDIQNLDNLQHYWNVVWSAPGQPAAVSLPAGHYSIQAFVGNWIGETATYTNLSFVTMPEVSITADASLTADARTARPLTVTVPHRTEVGQVSLHYRRSGQDARSLEAGVIGIGVPELRQIAGGDQPLPQLRVYATPTAAPKIGKLDFSSAWLLEPPDRAAGGNPAYVYYLNFPDTNGVNGFSHRLTASELTADQESYAADTSRFGIEVVNAFTPWSQFDIGLELYNYPVPGTHIAYYGGTPDTLWRQSVASASDPLKAAWLSGPARTLRPGTRLHDTWGAGPLIPAPEDETGMSGDPQKSWLSQAPDADVCPACRQDDILSLNLASSSDDAGHSALQASDATTNIRYYRNGTLVQEQDHAGGVFPMLPQPATYTIDWHTSLAGAGQPTTHLDTSVDSVWTFKSKRPDSSDKLPKYEYCAPDFTRGCSLTPLLFAHYDLGADLAGQVTSDGDKTIRISGYHQPNQPHPAALTSAKVDISFDDGTTWSPAEGVTRKSGSFVATVPSSAPKGSTSTGYASLRFMLADTSGSTLTQTIVHAYALPDAATVK